MSQWQDRSEQEQINLAGHPKLKQHAAIDKLADALPEPLLRGFRYGELRGTVLVLHFTHPGHLGEFKLRKEEILARMRTIYKEQGLRDAIVFRDVKAEQRYHSQSRTETKPPTVSAYDEPAKGNFENDITHTGLRASLERIREIIKERQDD